MSFSLEAEIQPLMSLRAACVRRLTAVISRIVTGIDSGKKDIISHEIYTGIDLAHKAKSLLEIESNARQLLTTTPGPFRIIFMRAPGFGDYATSLDIMNKMRQLGYSGRFEIFYEEGAEGKLSYLFPEFKSNISQAQEISSAQATAYPLSELKNMPLSELGIIGGTDYKLTADTMNVKHLLVIQPPGGWRPAYASRHSSLPVAPVPDLQIPDELGSKLVDNSEDPISSLRNASPALARKEPGIEALLNPPRPIEIMSAYGLGDAPGLLHTIVESIRLAQIKKPDAFNGPVVVAMLSKLNQQEWKLILPSLNKIKSGGGKIVYLNTRDPRASQKLASLGKKDIVIMRIAGVPQPVWNAVMKKSTLPASVSGTSGINFLQNHGIPYFTTVKWSNDPGSIISKNPDFMKAKKAILKMDSKALSQYLLTAMDPNSTLRQAFLDQKAALDAEPDRATKAFSSLWEYLQENPE